MHQNHGILFATIGVLEKSMFGKIAIGAILGAILGYGATAFGVSVTWMPSGFSSLGHENEALIGFAGVGAFIGLCLGIVDR